MLATRLASLEQLGANSNLLCACHCEEGVLTPDVAIHLLLFWHTALRFKKFLYTKIITKFSRHCQNICGGT